MFKSIMGKIGNLLKPLWKGAAKKILANQAQDLRGRLKSMVDSDEDASLKRVNALFDGWQASVIARVRALSFLPASVADTVASGVQREGDILQGKIVAAIKEKGPHAIDLAFEGIEVKLNALIDAA
jgi:hypothetical protein